jgi:hypothetical protein
MRRREFLAALRGAAAWPLEGRAQPVRRIGALIGYPEADKSLQVPRPFLGYLE